MFVHLNNHSDYSLQKSISRVNEIVNRAAELQQSAVAITDYGNLFAVPEFVLQCKRKNIKAIIGCEICVVDDMRKKNNDSNHSLILLCQSALGYENLKKISSSSYIGGFYYYPRIDLHYLKMHQEGLICIVPQNDSRTSKLLDLGKLNDAKAFTEVIHSMFEDRLYFEIQNHGLTSELRLNQKIATLAKEMGLSLVVGNDCHYIHQNDSSLHDIFINTDISSKKKLSFSNDQYYMKSIEEIQIHFKDYPEAIENTVEIANRCHFEYKSLGAKLPSFTLPEGFHTEDEYLVHLSWEGIHTRYSHIDQTLKDRVNFELGVITKMGYSGYFLITWDIIEYARKSDIPVGLGRGSGAGSIIAYALGITNVEPLRFKLLFERFLNPERISMPDIDTDFCMDRRQEVIDYIKEKYGHDKVCQIITFSQLKPKGALRDVARSMEVPLNEVDEMAKLIPFDSKSLQNAIDIEPKLQEYYQGKFKALFEATDKIVGLHRHASLHAGGIVIGASDLTDYVPLYRDPSSESIATQFTMNHLESCGLVKMDILGLRTLTIVDKTLKLIQKEQADFTIDSIPEEDPRVYEMLSNGDSESVFQFESEGMQRTLTKVKPKRIEDLIAINALFRPGPREFIDEYARINNGNAKAYYLHEDLIPILEETHGIILYQEQVMEIAKQMAGFTLGEADILRKAMGKKIVDEINRLEPQFIEGAIQNGYSRETAENIYQQLKPFGAYGFNKSHSAAYAILAYQTAYLKLYYPGHYMAACINANANKPDELAKQLKVCLKMGLDIYPPDVNHSNYEFALESNGIRYGLIGIKGMSDEFKKHIPKERAQNGSYQSVMDFLSRLPSHNALQKFLNIAIPVGLFDSVEPDRIKLLEHIDFLEKEAYERIEAKKEHRVLLFNEEAETQFETKNNTRDNGQKKGEGESKANQEKIISLEREYLGMNLSSHPLDPVKDLWLRCTSFDTTRYAYLPLQLAHDTPHYIVAYIEDLRLIKKAHREMYVGSLVDYHGEIPFMYSQNSVDSNKIILEQKKVYGFMGRKRKFREGSEPVFYLKSILSPEELYEEKERNHPSIPTLFDHLNRPYNEFHIRVQLGFEKEDGVALGALLNNYEYAGETRVYLHTNPQDKREEVIALPHGICVDARNNSLIEKMKALDCIDSYWCV